MRKNSSNSLKGDSPEKNTHKKKKHKKRSGWWGLTDNLILGVVGLNSN